MEIKNVLSKIQETKDSYFSGGMRQRLEQTVEVDLNHQNLTRQLCELIENNATTVSIKEFIKEKMVLLEPPTVVIDKNHGQGDVVSKPDLNDFPLLVAINNQREDVAVLLLHMGDNPNVYGYPYNAILCAFLKLPSMVQKLLNVGALPISSFKDLPDEWQNKGEELICGAFCCFNGDMNDFFAIIQNIIDNGYDINKIDINNLIEFNKFGGDFEKADQMFQFLRKNSYNFSNFKEIHNVIRTFGNENGLNYLFENILTWGCFFDENILRNEIDIGYTMWNNTDKTKEDLLYILDKHLAKKQNLQIWSSLSEIHQDDPTRKKI